MFGKKKDDRGLPDLPPSKITPPMLREIEKEEVNTLPAFPDSPHKKGFSQSAIKEAVSPTNETNFDLPKFKEPEMPEFPDEYKPKKIRELEEWSPEEEPMQRPSFARAETISKSPVYVRLDKFNEAKSSLRIIYDKILEVEKALDEIKEIKRKEDEEISLWEKEIDLIKNRINSVGQELFEKV